MLHFKTAAAATSFYNQAYAKYKQCTAFTVPDPADNTQYELTLRSLSKTTVGKNKAFQVIQFNDVTALPALAFYANTAVVLSGTNVYTIDDVNGTNDPISVSLLGDLRPRSRSGALQAPLGARACSAGARAFAVRASRRGCVFAGR